MRLLFDTHAWLWMVADPDRLSREAGELLEDAANELYLSAASSWEIAIKVGIGRLRLPERPAKYVPMQIERTGVMPLPIAHGHALRVASLPPHHRDPFDRLLVAQAQLEELAILTADPRFESYDVELVRAA